MISLASDYTTGCHESILKRMMETNLEPATGYGTDIYTQSATAKIRETIGCPDADVYYLVGGTQANSVVISTMLLPYEGVLAADTGHIAVHEAGAVEYTGHKVLTLSHKNGLIDPAVLKAWLVNFYADGNHEHMVYPGMVYISYPTELGTLYKKSQLEEIYAICKEYGLKLFIDGARLGYGLLSSECDMTIQDIANNCDCFYIGGTKVGALCGEAIVFPRNNAPKHFYTMTKQHGAMLAKGKLIGIQFDTLFTDNLYFDISKHAIEMADQLKKILSDCKMNFFMESPTNQQYIVVDNETMKKLEQKIVFSFWETVDENHTAIRFVTSWSTTQADLDGLKEALLSL